MESAFLSKYFRFAWRNLTIHKGFALLVVSGLTIGIGANIAVFSVIQTVLLGSLPYRDSERLAVLQTADLNTGNPLSVSFPDFRDWREGSREFEEMAAVGGTTLALTDNEGTEHVDSEMVTAEYFRVLGVSALHGATFSSEQESRLVALLSHDFWQSRFGGDESVIGGHLQLNGKSFVLAGVLPPGFDGFVSDAKIWIPLPVVNRVRTHLTQYDFLQMRNLRWHQVLGKLRPGATLQSAQQEMTAIAAGVEEAHPVLNKGRGVRVISAQEFLLGDHRPQLLLLQAAIALVLVLTCVNLANLFLARSASRKGELAVRLALGARNSDLFRQMLAESLLLALLGGAGGLVLAWFISRPLAGFLLSGLPGFVQAAMDEKALIVTLTLSLGAGALFGAVPALASSRFDTARALQEAGRARTRSASTSRLSRIFAGLEVGLATMLLIAAVLVLQSLDNIQSVELGFRSQQLLSLEFELPRQKYSREEQAQLWRQVIEQSESLPEVESAALTSYLFFSRRWIRDVVVIEGRPKKEGEFIGIFQHRITPGYLAAMQIPLLGGRGFQWQDTADAPLVAVISKTLAERYWPAGNALGRRIRMDGKSGDNPWLTVVGIVGDVVHDDLREASPNPDVYLPLAQAPTGRLGLIVRTGNTTANPAARLRRQIRQLDREIPVFNVATLQARRAQRITAERSTAQVMSAFAAAALLLAVIGIYGVVSYGVRQRDREIGIRMALGARKTDVLRMVLGDGLRLCLLGIALGVVAALGLTRTLSGLLFGVSPDDPATFVAIPTLLALVILLGVLFPALRASRVDPVVTLKTE